MHWLALNVPGVGGDTNIPGPAGMRFSGPEQTSLGYVLSQFLNLAFYIALFLVFLWFVWGAYEYMVAEGQKEGLAHAKERMRYALVGFILLVAAFLVGNYAPNVFPFLRTFYAGEVPKVQDIGPNGEGSLNNLYTQPDCQQGNGQLC